MSLMKKRILVIDDEKPIRDVLGRFLTMLGYAVDYAEDGLSGLEKVRASRPDLIVVDVYMPGMDGLAFCSVLKSEEALKAIPVLFLTGEGKLGVADDAFRDGANAFLTKPVDFPRLKDKIETLLGLRR
ncbi:MAG: response regulator [Elusimicrobia bacterium]|nr:response regulator [Elusimicrobiota bacterium]